jgi:uncharacterized protein (TIGR03067 family)
MIRRIAGTLGLILAVVVMVRADGGPSTADYTVSADDRAELERGEWRVVAMTSRGKEIPKNLLEQRDLRMAFKGNKLIQNFAAVKGGDSRDIPLKINAAAMPREIEWRQSAKISYVGIYKLENGTLTIALGRGERPKDFSPETAYVLYVLKRVKP